MYSTYEKRHYVNSRGKRKFIIASRKTRPRKSMLVIYNLNPPKFPRTFSYCFYKIFCVWSLLAWEISLNRSSHRRCSIKKLFLKISQYSQENTCVGIFFLIKLQPYRPATLLKETPTQVFPVNISKFLRIPILKNTCERLLLP